MLGVKWFSTAPRSYYSLSATNNFEVSKMQELTYSQSGVDREKRKQAKDFSAFDKSLVDAVRTPYLTMQSVGDDCVALLADGVGTKVLLAQLADKHDTVGIDGVAMVANDAGRAGLQPKMLVDIIDIHHSEPALVSSLIAGISKGAKQAGCAVVGGETADVPTLVNGVGSNPYNLNFSLYASAPSDEVILGTGLKAGDTILGLESSGLHSNGFSLVRSVFFKQWGGHYEDAFAKVDGLDKPLVEECLTPTRIYAKEIREFQSKNRTLKAAAHITGDAYTKFDKLLSMNKGTGLEFDNFKPQPIFGALQKTAGKMGKKLSDEEMLRTFNLGWGFALFVSPADADDAISFFSSRKIRCERIGTVTQKAGLVRAKYNSKDYSFQL